MAGVLAMDLSKANAGALVRAVLDIAHASDDTEITDADMHDALETLQRIAASNPPLMRDTILTLANTIRETRWQTKRY